MEVNINTIIFASSNKNKEVLEKYTEVWGGEKNLFENIKGRLGEYEKDFIKIKLNFCDNLPLNKTLKVHNLIVIVTSIFQEDNKYYPQVFLDEGLYEVFFEALNMGHFFAMVVTI